MNTKKEKITIAVAGAITGAIAAALVLFGNPSNMGFCIACFIRDTVGALELHSASNVQYIRPEIIGIVIGAFAVALARKEFSPRGGSSPLTRFIIAFFVMIGCLVFLGCPFRMILRIAAGDMNAVIGLLGFALGISAGIFFLNKGFSLGRTHKQSLAEGGSFCAIQIVLLVLLIVAPSFIAFSQEGPGASHAPIYISLAAGIIVGLLAQRTRLCMVGGIRDIFLFKDFKLILGFGAVFVAALVTNIITGKFNFGFESQPIAHTEWLWNLLGMFLVGFGCVLLGGCPLRQLILAGEGNSDSAITVLGLAAGAAFSHNFGLASSAEGATAGGKIAVIIGIAVLAIIAVLYTFKIGKKAKN